MIKSLRQQSQGINLWTFLIILAVLLAAVVFGMRASTRWLMLIIAALGALVLLWKPVLGLLAIVLAALLVPVNISTGTEVAINPVTLLIPAMLVVWLLDMLRRKDLRPVSSRTMLPLALFLLAGLLSLLIGNVMWDPGVPRAANFGLVQLAQWAIFAFSAAAYVLAANLIKEESWLRRLTWAFVLVGGILAVASAVVGVWSVAGKVATLALVRTPFWVLLAALAGGQLLFNRRLAISRQVLLLGILAVVIIYAFVQERIAVSNWIGIGVVLAVLLWLRFPRFGWVSVPVIIVSAVVGGLGETVYQFAGGDYEWIASGASRLVLIERVLEVTMRNPITGLGPAAYRLYTEIQPLAYGSAVWVSPMVNSHNNYVDLFAHTGIVGLVLFMWFMIEVAWLGWRLHRRYRTGFVAGYANALLASWVAVMVIMLLLDWFLPFVYNVSFEGFQASVLVWLFMGGLVAIEAWSEPGTESEPSTT